MLFWFFPFVGTVLFLLSEKRSSCHRKSTVPTIGKALFRSPEKELFNFRSVASSAGLSCYFQIVSTGSQRRNDKREIGWIVA